MELDLSDIPGGIPGGSEGFEKFLKYMKKQQHGQDDKPNNKYLSFIPHTLRSNVLTMTSTKLTKDSMVTLFIGTIRVNYTRDMWKKDVDQWKEYFGSQKYHNIDMLPVKQGTSSEPAVDQMDSRDAIPKIEKALDDLFAQENISEIRLRIICLGTGYSQFLYEAITFLLKEWKENKGVAVKYLQFVTSGDTGENNLCSFCRWLCVSGVVETIQFYNSREYHPFGYCAATYN